MEERSRWITENARPSDGDFLHRSGVQTETKNIKAIKRTPREELYIMWRDLVQKQRMHEMIKCLQAEKKKLQILHSNVDQSAEFFDFAAEYSAKQEAKRQSTPTDHKKERDSVERSAPTEDAPRTAAGPEKEGAEPTEKDVPKVGSRSSSGKVQLAGDGLYSKRTITDQEFEDIIELCEDKVEQKALREAFQDKKSRDKYLHNADELIIMIYNFINSKFLANFMLITIIVSIVGIFLLTFETIAIRYAWPLIMLDSCIIGIFLIESILKVVIYKQDYFRSVWNLLDMLIIIVHFVEIFVDLITRTLALSTDLNASLWFKFLKSLRALRLLRVIKFLPNLQVIVTTVFQSMLSIGSIAVLMLLFIFVFAVMGRGLFYERVPNKFGNLWLSFVTLFQLLTLDDWFELLETGSPSIEDEYGYHKETDLLAYWLMFAYLFAYLVMEYFVFLNLFVAVLVDNFQLTLADVEIQKQKEAMEELEAQKKFDNIKKEVLDPILAEEEQQRHLAELGNLGLYVDDYFPIDKDGKEAQHLSDFYKNLNSVDFERFLWKRRFSLFNMIIDAALTSRQNATAVRPVREESDNDDDNESSMDKKSSVAGNLRQGSKGASRISFSSVLT